MINTKVQLALVGSRDFISHHSSALSSHLVNFIITTVIIVATAKTILQ